MFKKVGLGLLVLATFGLVIAFSWHWTNNQSVVLSCGGWGCEDGGHRSFFERSGNLKNTAKIIEAQRTRIPTWNRGNDFNVLQNFYADIIREVNGRLEKERENVKYWEQKANLYEEEKNDATDRADRLQTLVGKSNAEIVNIEKKILQTQRKIATDRADRLQTELSDLQSKLTKLHRSQTSTSTTIDLKKTPTAKNRTKFALPVGLGITALAGAGSGGYFLYKKFGNSLPDLLEKLKFWKK